MSYLRIICGIDKYVRFELFKKYETETVLVEGREKYKNHYKP